MECSESRKKLKNYAAGEIRNNPEKKEIEAHITGCPVCKRELLMWQDVLDRQKALGAETDIAGSSLKDKVDRINRDMEIDSHLPPAIRRIRTLARGLKTGKGRLIWQILFVMFAPLFLLVMLKRDISPLFIILILISCACLLYVVIKTRGIK